MAAGDVLIGLPSSGLHTNGYSLARKVCFELEQLDVNDLIPGTDPAQGQTVAQALLAIHRSYLRPVMPLVKAHKLVAMAHITGGGLTDNIPRVLPGTLDAEIDTASWQIPALFRFLMEKGGLGLEDARQALNLGVGMVLVVKAERVEEVLTELHEAEEPAWVLGRLVPGTGTVIYQ
jgi:phosphoribosylformylglycinamidine cyclo-ligase